MNLQFNIKKILLFITIIIFITVGFLSLKFINNLFDWDSDGQKITKLEGSFNLIEELKVTRWEEDKICRQISYSRGDFILDNKDPSCFRYESRDIEYVIFDSAAKDDHDKIRFLMQNLKVSKFIASYNQENKVKTARFYSNCLLCDGQSYAYSPNELDSFLGSGNSYRSMKINDNWAWTMTG